MMLPGIEPTATPR